MGILMFIGTYFQSVFISPIPPFTTLGPLFVILMITSAKEGYEDMFRHRSDAKARRPRGRRPRRRVARGS